MNGLSLYRVEDEDGTATHLVVTTGEAEALILAGYGPTDPGHAWVPVSGVRVSRIAPDKEVSIREETSEHDWVTETKTAAEWCANGEGFLASTEW